MSLATSSDSADRMVRWLIAALGAVVVVVGLIFIATWWGADDAPDDVVPELDAADIREVEEVIERLVRDGSPKATSRLREARDSLIARARETSRLDLKAGRALSFDQHTRRITDVKGSSSRRDVLIAIGMLNDALLTVGEDVVVSEDASSADTGAVVPLPADGGTDGWSVEIDTTVGEGGAAATPPEADASAPAPRALEPGADEAPESATPGTDRS